MLTSQQL